MAIEFERVVYTPGGGLPPEENPFLNVTTFTEGSKWKILDIYYLKSSVKMYPVAEIKNLETGLIWQLWSSTLAKTLYTGGEGTPVIKRVCDDPINKAFREALPKFPNDPMLAFIAAFGSSSKEEIINKVVVCHRHDYFINKSLGFRALIGFEVLPPQSTTRATGANSGKNKKNS